jgi:hypothetical protein
MKERMIKELHCIIGTGIGNAWIWRLGYEADGTALDQKYRLMRICRRIVESSRLLGNDHVPLHERITSPQSNHTTTINSVPHWIFK